MYEEVFNERAHKFVQGVPHSLSVESGNVLVIDQIFNASRSQDSHFKLEVSINNTQLWKKYTFYEADIKQIEKSLKEYLYPFEKYNLTPSFTLNSSYVLYHSCSV